MRSQNHAACRRLETRVVGGGGRSGRGRAPPPREMSGEPAPSSATIIGTVRKRRTLSKRLTFVDLECDEADEPRIALVCEWLVPKSVVAGLRVRVEGLWETTTRGDVAERRLAVLPERVEVLEDRRARNAWANAAESAAWRARVRDSDSRPDADVMCLSWADFGRCSDPACVLRHAASTRWETRRRERADSRRAAATAAVEDDEVAHGASGDAAKSKHNAVFARWLVDTFGIDRLVGDGAGVVDIAGGRGMLALELALEHGVPATLIEPRPLRLNKSYRKRIRRWRRNRRAALRGSRDAESLGDVATEDVDDDATEESPIRHLQAAFHGVGSSADSSEVSEAVRRSSVVLGMHPDAATSPIVDAAIRLGKPFAVVPCCVFASLHPERRTPDGRPVATYEDLLEHLRAKAPDVERDELRCEGRNVVLYRRDSATDAMNSAMDTPG